LFLALLLASFSSDVLTETETEDDENKIAEAINRIRTFFSRKEPSDLVIEMQTMNNSQIISICPDEETETVVTHPPDCCPNAISKHFTCCSKLISKRMKNRWLNIRRLAHRFVEQPFFEWFIIGTILISSITLVS